MPLMNMLRNPQRRAVKLSRFKKACVRPFQSCHESIPVMVFGLQRSGTTMLMDVFYLHPDTEVYDEGDGRAFTNCMLKELTIIDQIIATSRAKHVCFKPLMDSYNVTELLARYNGLCAIWMYRDYRDVAHSRLRRFKHANRATRLVIEGKPGGGAFAAGLSPATKETLRQFQGVSEFDLACLTWWAQNQLVVENELQDKVILINYEGLVTNPTHGFGALFSSLGMRPYPRALRFVHPRSIKKASSPPIDSDIETLCENLKAHLDSSALNLGSLTVPVRPHDSLESGLQRRTAT
jgi:hypothetical protein